MKRALDRADFALKDFNFDAETTARLRTSIANAVIEERRAVNSEIQLRLSVIKISVAEDLEAVRREIEQLLHPTPLL